MHRQVGNLVLDARGIAVRGVLVRHLVLPQGLSGTAKVLSFIAREISCGTYINLMDQYHPCYRAGDSPQLSSPLTSAEYRPAAQLCAQYNLRRLHRKI